MIVMDTHIWVWWIHTESNELVRYNNKKKK